MALVFPSFTACSNFVKVLNVQNGDLKYTIGEAEDESRATSFAISHDDSQFVVTYANDLIKKYSLANNEATLDRQFRGTHNAPVLITRFSPDSSRLATGSADFSVKMWDLKKQFCTHNLKGKSVVSAMCFIGNDRLLVGYTEGDVKLFDLENKGIQPTEWKIHTSHISTILPLTLPGNAPGAVIVSRDRTYSILNVETKEKLKLIPIFEPVEDAVFLRNPQNLLTVGEEGVLKVWDIWSGRMLKKKAIIGKRIDTVLYREATGQILCVTCDQNLLFVDENTLTMTKQLSGFNDEIFASTFLSEKSNCLVVATNSPEIRIYDMNSWSCHLLQGHEESVLSVDSPPWDEFLFASSSKDNSIIVWRLRDPSMKLEEEEKDAEFEAPIKVAKVAVATGHTNSVAAVQFSKHKDKPFILSVSDDGTLKLWPIQKILTHFGGESLKLSASFTIVAHHKLINCVEVSPNDKICITGSMDKTAKLWHIDKDTMNLGIAGTLSGHKKGVWLAKFAPNSQNVATCSGDSTIKIFSLLDKTCLMTLSGHDFAILALHFVRNGNKLLSADSGGLMKVWNLETGVCDQTIEAHEDKVWHIELIERARKDDEYVTVGADGKIIVWKDVSEEVQLEEARKRAERAANQQTLANFMDQEKYEEALMFALDLAQPFHCLTVINHLTHRGETEKLGKVLKSLSSSQLSMLMDFTAQWNTNTRTYNASQQVIHYMLKTYHPDDLLKLPGINRILQALIPYTNRHYERLSKLKSDAAYLNYVYSRMRLD
uniref:U3 small nucleolar RNA-associated protein 13 C-terminal domain-containing protein n=1 Tax=Acrobeloides nanus TaxID=290746 RepID=A0A914DIJ3_9BILA